MKKEYLSLAELKGDWALVTGASAGIGKEFCSQLAGAGVNVVMVARRKELLLALADELKKKFSVQCVIIDADLVEETAVTKIKSVLRQNHIRIRLLVNNAALGFYGKLDQMPQDLAERMLKLNVFAVSSLCLAFLEDLRSHSSAAIINLSSQAALNPIPGSALYAASKAFVHSLSLSLFEELRNSPVFVQTLIPGPTETESTQKSDARLSHIKDWNRSADLVRISLNRLQDGSPIVTTAKGIYLQKLFVTLMPVQMVLRQVGSMFLKGKDEGP